MSGPGAAAAAAAATQRALAGLQRVGSRAKKKSHLKHVHTHIVSCTGI